MSENYFGINYKYYPEQDSDHPEAMYEMFRNNEDFTTYINNHYVRKDYTNESIVRLMREPEIYAKYLASYNHIDRASRAYYVKHCKELLDAFIENKDFFWLDAEDEKFDRITRMIISDDISTSDIQYIVEIDKFMAFFTEIMKAETKKHYIRGLKKRKLTNKRRKAISNKLDELLQALMNLDSKTNTK